VLLLKILKKLLQNPVSAKPVPPSKQLCDTTVTVTKNMCLIFLILSTKCYCKKFFIMVNFYFKADEKFQKEVHCFNK
jgi:hypothetical protein